MSGFSAQKNVVNLCDSWYAKRIWYTLWTNMPTWTLSVSAKYLAEIPNRDKVQDIENAKNFLGRNSIAAFGQLEKYKTDKGKEFDRRCMIRADH